MNDLTNAQIDANLAQTDANTTLTKAQAIRQLADGGYTRDSVRDAVTADDLSLLVDSDAAFHPNPKETP